MVLRRAHLRARLQGAFCRLACPAMLPHWRRRRCAPPASFLTGTCLLPKADRLEPKSVTRVSRVSRQTQQHEDIKTFKHDEAPALSQQSESPQPAPGAAIGWAKRRHFLLQAGRTNSANCGH